MFLYSKTYASNVRTNYVNMVKHYGKESKARGENSVIVCKLTHETGEILHPSDLFSKSSFKLLNNSELFTNSRCDNPEIGNKKMEFCYKRNLYITRVGLFRRLCYHIKHTLKWN